jgi:hypothetical protein
MKKECFDIHLPLVQRTVRTIGRRWAMHQVKTKKSVELKPICYCFADRTIKRITDRVKPGHTSALLIHDFSCQLVPDLLAKGITDITIGIHTDHLVNSDNLFKFTVLYIKNTFKQFNLKFMKVSDTIGMHFDLIISNPPYGAVGADITKSIIKHVTFNQFINLLPANDYTRNAEKDLYKYATNMEPINNGFVGVGANVTTHLAEISIQANEITPEEFEINQYQDKKLTKYFLENSKRKNTWIYETSNMSANKPYDTADTIIIGWRDPVNKHMPYTRNCTTYKWNVESSIDFAYVIEQHFNKAGNSVPFGCLRFATPEERNNLSQFMYSTEGFKFFSMVFSATGKDMLNSMKKFMPKVDWTRSWTVEEILVDYGYTEDEIQEVVADLAKFKDMERD